MIFSHMVPSFFSPSFHFRQRKFFFLKKRFREHNVNGPLASFMQFSLCGPSFWSICIFVLQPKIDKDSLESLSTECPRIIVNPKPSLFGHKGIDIPQQALAGVPLDEFVVEDINSETWAVPASRLRTNPPVSSTIELPIAERFRLAFVERDARLAPKRAKNARQRQRRAERDWVTTSTNAKSMVLAAQMSKKLRN